MQKRIVIVTNMDEQCGNAQYARDLRRHLQNFKGTAVITLVGHITDILRNQLSYDVVVLNWHPARVEVSVPLVRQLRSVGMRVILILQNSFDYALSVAADDILVVCDAVVTHEPMTVLCEGKPLQNLHYIPHGIVPASVRWRRLQVIEPYIGTAGWPFPWKRPDVVAKAAAHVGKTARIFCPPYPGFNWPVASWGPNVEAVGGWNNEETVVKVLNKNMFNIFWFQSQQIEDKFGQSGSVRLGIAAQRPMIISRHRKFRTLLDEYPEEFYIADTEEDVYTLAKQLTTTLEAGEAAKIPVKCLKNQNWWRAAERYWGVINTICN